MQGSNPHCGTVCFVWGWSVCQRFLLVASGGHIVSCFVPLLNVAVWNHTTPPAFLQHHCPPSLTSSLHPLITCIHPAPLRLLCSRSSFLYMWLFFCWQCSHLFFWLCIVSLSPVSRQWFYPMVGDIMLFYHRVEPRTGCWEVSASVRPSVRQSITPSHKPRGRGQGPWERLVLVLQLVVVLLVGPHSL